MQAYTAQFLHTFAVLAGRTRVLRIQFLQPKGPLMVDLSLGTFVTYNPRAIAADASVGEVRRAMDEYQVRHIPVVDDERRIVGVVSHRDLARVQIPELVPLNTDEPSTAAWDECPLRVADVMTSDVITIDQNDTPMRVLEVFLQHHIHSAPVVEAGRLLGVVTSGDFLRELSYGELPCCRETVGRHMHDQHARIDYLATAADTWRTMADERTEFLAVVRGDCPVGVVSKRSLRAASGEASEMNTSLDFLDGAIDAAPREIASRVTLAVAAGAMIEQRQEALPVVQRSHHLVGLITEDKLLEAITADLT